MAAGGSIRTIVGVRLTLENEKIWKRVRIAGGEGSIYRSS